MLPIHKGETKTRQRSCEEEMRNKDAAIPTSTETEQRNRRPMLRRNTDDEDVYY
jgi:hypothetical protein